MTRPGAAALLLLVAVAAGCAASKAAQPGAVVPAGREPTTLEEAQAQLESAHAQLGGAPFITTPATTSADAASGPQGGGGSPAEPRKSTSGYLDESKQDPCALACRAIESMRRATEAICRLAGADDRRCVDARKTLAADGAKVARCGCP